MHSIIKINMSNNDPASQVSSSSTPPNLSCMNNSNSPTPTTTNAPATTSLICNSNSDVPTENSASGSQSTLLPNYLASLKDRIAQLCESLILSDVKFKVGEENKDAKEFCGHKLILAISSPVFSAMFYGPMKMSTEYVEIPDCKAEAFQKLLQFAYKNELNVSDVQLVLDVLYAARKYSMRLLEDECMAYLCGNVSYESVLAVKEAAEKYQLPILESVCTDYIEEHALEVLKHHHPYLTVDTLIQTIKNDRLNIKEIDLFLILSDWAKQECERVFLEGNVENKRKMLEPCLHYIRFPTMDASDFADHVVPTSILTTAEIARILTYISTTDKNQLQDTGFSSSKRSLKLFPGLKFNSSIDKLASNSFFIPQSVTTTTTDRPPRSYHRSRKRSRNNH